MRGFFSTVMLCCTDDDECDLDVSAHNHWDLWDDEKRRKWNTNITMARKNVFLQSNTSTLNGQSVFLV